MSSKSAHVTFALLAGLLPAVELAAADTLSFRSARIPSGAATLATLTMDQAVTRDVSLNVSVAGTNSAQAPTGIQLANGQSRVEFPITSAAAAAEQFADITIRDPGSGRVVASARLTVTPPALVSLVLNRSEVVGGTVGSTVTGTVTMDGVAAGHGLTVPLGTACPSCAQFEQLPVPPSVLVPSGARTATFSLEPQVTSVRKQHSVLASQAGVVKTAALSNTVLLPQSVAVSPSTIAGSQTATLTVTLNAPAYSGGYPMKVSCSAPLLVTIAGVGKPCAPGNEPKTVSFAAAAGQSSTSFQVRNSQVTSPTQVILRVATERGDANGIQTTLTVAP